MDMSYESNEFSQKSLYNSPSVIIRSDTNFFLAGSTKPHCFPVEVQILNSFRSQVFVSVPRQITSLGLLHLPLLP